jgi:enoyl-CoA hydratase/carnithine racemase
MGLVNKVVPQPQLRDAAKDMARAILANGPVAVRLAKEAIHEGLATDLAHGLLLEQKAFGLVFATHDQKEGMKAFTEKRKPSWKGE